MIINYLKIAFRNLSKQKGYTFINLLGLATGLTCFVLIALYIQFELSYDRFHEKSDRIYRVSNRLPGLDYLGTDLWANTPAPLLEALHSEIGLVESATQIAKSSSLIEKQEQRFYEDGIFATNQFFDVFSFPLISGDPSSALSEPQNIILTRSLANKYFGSDDPVGKTITVSYLGEMFSGINEMKVTGVMEDVPDNSHFHFSYIVPVNSCREFTNYIDSWNSSSFLTYTTLLEGHTREEFESLLLRLNDTYSELQESEKVFLTQPLTSIHLHSHINGEFNPNGDIRNVYLFALIAFLILLIAAINYVNLAMARSTLRVAEVGVRKTMGAFRSQLIWQFLSEAIIPSIISLLLSLVFVELLIPVFNNLTGNSIGLNYSSGFFMGIIFTGFMVGVLAGLYPAFIMSGFKPINLLKGIGNSIHRKSRFRNVLVSVQFVISFSLIVTVLVILQQLHFIQNTSTGVDRDQIIALPIEDKVLYERYPAFKQVLLQHPNIESVTAGQSEPININSSTLLKNWEGSKEDESLMVYRSIIQLDYLKTFGLEITEGEDFNLSRKSDLTEGVIINETTKKQLGWESAVGKKFPFRDGTRIIGVVKDFKFLSFHHEIAPLAFTLESGWWFPYQKIFIKVEGGNTNETLEFIEKSLAKFSSGFPFEYYFLDQAYDAMYKKEKNLGTLLKFFASVAVFISCLGLLGLASFIAQQRAREIGIRKVLGAGIADILTLITNGLTQLIAISFIISIPVSHYFTNKWLSGFAYKVSVEWYTFAAAGGLVLFLAWTTVSYQSIRAALTNPVDSLKQE